MAQIPPPVGFLMGQLSGDLFGDGFGGNDHDLQDLPRVDSI